MIALALWLLGAPLMWIATAGEDSQPLPRAAFTVAWPLVVLAALATGLALLAMDLRRCRAE